MARRTVRIAEWAALVVGVLTAAMTVTVAVIGVLALTDRVTYPVDLEFGPFSVQSRVSMPVGLTADVCRTADVTEQNRPSECFRFFLHSEDGPGANERIRRQDGDVRPTAVTLRGTAELATRGGWSPLVAASIARTTIGLAVVSGVLLMLWRLLAAAAAGDAFSSRAVRWVRGIGWLVIAGGVAQPVLDLFTGATQLGYSVESFGVGPQLEPLGPAGLNLAQLGLGVLILIVAEVFRHGAALEAERRLTV